MIEEVHFERLRLPLKEPYKLALGAVHAFDTILTRVVVSGREGWGEATILTGYTEETIEGGWALAEALAPKLVGCTAEAGKALAQAELKDAPFTLTACVSALEMAEEHPILNVTSSNRVPLLVGINATDPTGIRREIEHAVARGFDTLKIKAGFDLETDLKRVVFIQRCSRGRAKLRIDANQGYTREEGVRFVNEISPESIELVEQPCAAGDWDAAAAVCATRNVPLMLDESIYDLDDIRRASSIGASFVKLKLMKMGGLTALVEGLELIRAVGMQPVLGNGVASDLGCWMEACVARLHITGAGEMNGFLRQREPLAATPLQVIGGKIELTPSHSLSLDHGRMAAFRVAQAHADRSSIPRRWASSR